MTDSAISGPIPSPGKRVALIGLVEEEKALAAEMSAPELELEVPRIWLDLLPISRLARNDAMVIASSLRRTQKGNREKETRGDFLLRWTRKVAFILFLESGEENILL